MTSKRGHLTEIRADCSAHWTLPDAGDTPSEMAITSSPGGSLSPICDTRGGAADD
jgi:hypothetical protein